MRMSDLYGGEKCEYFGTMEVGGGCIFNEMK